MNRSALDAPAGRERGFSVISLLVTMAVGLILTLGVSTVLVGSEGRSRGQLAVNDVQQNAAFVSSLLDTALRSAGSGFSNRWQETFGCRLNASRNGTGVLPRTLAWPAPFGAFAGELRVAPAIVGAGQSAGGSDVIMVMRGNAGFAEAPMEVMALGPPLGLRNTLGIAAGELLLLADGEGDCLLLQAGAVALDTVTLSGTGNYHTVTGATRSLVDFAPLGSSTVVASLGNAGVGGAVPANAPQFTLYGVGANRTLFALDLLGIEGTAAQPLAEGVIELRALYGVDTDDDGVLDAWVSPATAPWDAASLLDGSPASRLNLARIVALRVGAILRTQRAEREAVSGDVVLFDDLGAGLRRTRTLDADEARFRHRTVELTVPLRNVLMVRAP